VTFEVSVEEGLGEEYVPALLLQPLVENAVRHGTDDDLEPLLIDIRCTRSRSEEGRTDLRIAVRNEAASAFPERPSLGGLGLRNLKEQLTVSCGRHASIEATRASAREFLVVIRLPLQP
jgi:LytS/YehU family sensor histidine kinase